MNIKSFFNNNWIHFAILFLFLVITVAYFSPEFNGYGLKQHDIEQHKGMSNEIQHFRENTGEEPFWTNSMFGGMPAVQISILYNGNLFQKISIWFLGAIGVTSGIFLLPSGVMSVIDDNLRLSLIGEKVFKTVMQYNSYLFGKRPMLQW